MDHKGDCEQFVSWKDPVDAVLLGWPLVLVYPSPTTQPLGRIAPFKDDIGRWSSPPRGADIILAAWAQVQQRTANNQQLTLYIYICIYCLIAEIPILAYRNFHSTKFFQWRVIRHFLIFLHAHAFRFIALFQRLSQPKPASNWRRDSVDPTWPGRMLEWWRVTNGRESKQCISM